MAEGGGFSTQKSRVEGTCEFVYLFPNTVFISIVFCCKMMFLTASQSKLIKPKYPNQVQCINPSPSLFFLALFSGSWTKEWEHPQVKIFRLHIRGSLTCPWCLCSIWQTSFLHEITWQMCLYSFRNMGQRENRIEPKLVQWRGVGDEMLWFSFTWTLHTGNAARVPSAIPGTLGMMVPVGSGWEAG